MCTPLKPKSHQRLLATFLSPQTALTKRCREIYFVPVFISRNECLLVRFTLSVVGYIKMVETFSPYQKMHQDHPVEAKRLSEDIQSK